METTVRYCIRLELRGLLSGPGFDCSEILTAVMSVVMRFDLSGEP
jgi:hypothetical protein